jgi:hypothetical protein
VHKKAGAGTACAFIPLGLRVAYNAISFFSMSDELLLVKPDCLVARHHALPEELRGLCQ